MENEMFEFEPDLYPLFKEIENQMMRITEIDKEILHYLLEKALHSFIQGQYDEDYKIPFIRRT